jgi:hypothetical protein
LTRFLHANSSRELVSTSLENALEKRSGSNFLPRRFQSKYVSLIRGTASATPALFLQLAGRKQQCAGKSAPHDHDPRQVDLLAVIALLIIIVSAYVYYVHKPEPPSTTAFIVPSQSTHW